MEKAGACAIVLELVTPEAGLEVTAALKIPTIGIGAGKGTTGQIRVSYDLLGLTPWSRPGFVKEDLGFARQMTEMVKGIRKSGRVELG
jgi:3-methyl-2-oxobutanoate hydroxymethyltransferase